MSDERVPVEKFGRDHWSTFSYLGCVWTGRQGEIERARMRCDVQKHPHYADPLQRLALRDTGTKYPTLLADGKTIPHHDDWDCALDLVAAGLLENLGTGANPVFGLTDDGWRAFRAVTEHRYRNQPHDTFRWPA